MKVDFNNLRLQIAFSLDNVIKTLNEGILPEKEFASHQKDGKYKHWEGDVLVSKEDLEDDLDNLRNGIWALICCYEKGNDDYKELSDVLEENGGIANFNSEE